MTYLEDWNAEQRAAVEQWRRKNDELQAKLADIRVRASSSDGAAGVVVDARGKVLGIRLTPQALQRGEASLGETLTTVLQQAQSTAQSRVDALVGEFVETSAATQAGEFIRNLLGEDTATTHDKQARPRDIDDETFYERFNEDPLGRRR